MIQQTSERIVQYQNEMKILILYGAIGSMATVDFALFSSSAIRAIKMIVLSLLYISLNRALAKLRIRLKHSAHRPIPISMATPHMVPGESLSDLRRFRDRNGAMGRMFKPNT